MKTTTLTYSFIFLLIQTLALFSVPVVAQTTFNGELMQRGEYLNGFGSPKNNNLNNAAFIGQRARLKAQHEGKGFKIYVAAQDIRTWGSTQTTKINDGFLSLYEAYGEVSINDNLSVKLGRQELDYDDARFLGNLDWALQGRAHDIALLKYKKNDLTLHVGAAYNQNNQSLLQGNFYTVPAMYKTAQMLWLNKKANNLNVSFLLWNNGMQYLNFNGDSSRNEQIKYTQTIGLPKIEYTYNNLVATGFYYQQVGKDAANKDVNAFDANIDLTYVLNLNAETKNKVRFTAGYEILSGTSELSGTKTNNSYNPMFGTNHRHNGYMDYFYVGGRFNNSVGLQDAYFKVRYDFNPKFFVSLNSHWFKSAADLRDRSNTTSLVKADNHLGYEFDFTSGYVVNENVSVQAGYSQMYAGNSLKMLYGTNLNTNNNWAYLMVLIRPNNKAKFTGLKF